MLNWECQCLCTHMISGGIGKQKKKKKKVKIWLWKLVSLLKYFVCTENITNWKNFNKRYSWFIHLSGNESWNQLVCQQTWNKVVLRVYVFLCSLLQGFILASRKSMDLPAIISHIHWTFLFLLWICPNLIEFSTHSLMTSIQHGFQAYDKFSCWIFFMICISHFIPLSSVFL